MDVSIQAVSPLSSFGAAAGAAGVADWSAAGAAVAAGAVDGAEPVGRGHQGLGAGVLEHPELPVEVGDRVDAPDGAGTTLQQIGPQDDRPRHHDDDHEDHAHQLLDRDFPKREY